MSNNNSQSNNELINEIIAKYGGEIDISLLAEYRDDDSNNDDDKELQDVDKDELQKDGMSNTILNATNIANTETISRYGSAAKEHLVAYSGVDNETGQELNRSLKSISKYKVNPDDKDNKNLKQQAGFSAEVKEVARENAEKKISGDTTTTTRTDDIKKQQYGENGTIGGVNDPLYDHVEIDADGNIIDGSGTQMKFVGKNSKELTKKLLSTKYDKYEENNVPYEIPSDKYEEVKEELAKRAKEYRKQAEALTKKGDIELAQEQLSQAEKCENIEKKLVKSKVSTEDAMEARLNPELSTLKDVAKISHRAAVEAAKTGAAIGGAMSFITNTIAVLKGEKDAKEAAADVGKTTAVSAASGYGTAFASVAFKGALQNAKSDYLQALAKTNLPGTVVSIALTVGKSVVKLGRGELELFEFFEEIGESGVGMLSSAAAATAATSISVALGLGAITIGSVAIPIAAVAALVGGMIGYAVSTGIYRKFIDVFAKEARLAREERIRVEEECRRNIEMIKAYRAEMEMTISEYFADNYKAFNSAFEMIESGMNFDDIDMFMEGCNTITKQVGGEVQFNNFDEFDEFMESDETLCL